MTSFIFLCLLLLTALTHADNTQGNQETNQMERATWLETRGENDNLKEAVFNSIQELIEERRLVDIVAGERAAAAAKRGRHQGFCFKKTKSGRFLPYICWKGAE